MGIFDTDVSCLKQLVIEDRPTRQREISQFLTENVTKKFCSLCSHFNIDHLDPLALHAIILLMCKSRDSMRVCSRFLAQHEQTQQIVSGILEQPQQIVSGILLDPKFAKPEDVGRESPRGDGQRQN